MSSNGKKILVFGIILVLIIVGVIIGINLTKKPDVIEPGDKPIIEPETQFTAAEQIVVETYKIINPSKNKDIRAEIPKIVNLSNKAFQEYINQKMLKTVTDYKSEMDIMVDADTSLETLYKYVVTYEKYANDRYLSLVVNNNYQTGGMRSNIWKDTYNIDVTQDANKEVFLKNLFSAETDYKSAILKEINTQAETKNYELVGGNGLSNLPDTQKFYIKDKKLIIYFDAAAIAPYVLGELEFEMPFTYENGKFKI